MTTYTSRIVQNGDLTYRIEMRQDAMGVWHQRHIWIENGTEKADAWIVSSRRSDAPPPNFLAMEAA